MDYDISAYTLTIDPSQTTRVLTTEDATTTPIDVSPDWISFLDSHPVPKSGGFHRPNSTGTNTTMLDFLVRNTFDILGGGVDNSTLAILSLSLSSFLSDSLSKVPYRYNLMTWETDSKLGNASTWGILGNETETETFPASSGDQLPGNLYDPTQNTIIKLSHFAYIYAWESAA